MPLLTSPRKRHQAFWRLRSHYPVLGHRGEAAYFINDMNYDVGGGASKLPHF